MATVRKRILPSGKTAWLAGYTDAAGARRFKQFTTRKEADAFLLQARSEVSTGVHVPSSRSVTVATAAQQWLAAAEANGLERSTVNHYRTHVVEHIRPFLGAMKLTAVTTPRVYAFMDDLKAAGRSPEMVRRAVQSLGRVFRHARGRGLVGSNPVSDVKVPSSKRTKPRPEIPTKDELRDIVAAAQGRWRPLIITACSPAFGPASCEGCGGRKST